MTIQNIAEHLDQAVQALKVLDVDSQLALMWDLFYDIKEQLNPGGEEMTGDDVASDLVERLKQMSKDEQLQALRNLMESADTNVTQDYRSFSEKGKLFFWYLLAQSTETGSTATIPFNYEKSAQAKELLEQLKTLKFQKKVDFISSTVANLGA